MNEHVISKLRRHWLGAATVSLILPIFLPSTSIYVFPNLIGMSAIFLFLISFPTSLLIAPISAFKEMFFGPSYFSIGGIFGNLVILFGLGAFQWFWLIPRIVTTQQQFRENTRKLTLAMEESASSIPWQQDRSPVELLIDDGDLRK